MRQTYRNMPSMRETHPHLAEEFHPTKNGDLTPDNLIAGTHKRVWWICSTCENEWKTSPSLRSFNGTGCRVCNVGTLHSDGRNSMANTYPELAKEYQGDATKIVAGTNKKLDWKCSTCDHEWKATGSDRVVKNSGCPYCNKNVLHSDGRNSMANTNPELAKDYQGDATKIIAGTHKKLPWKCSTCDHEWELTGNTRKHGGNGCPCCNNSVIHKDGRNSMAVTHPELAKEYQGDATKIVAGTNKRIPWKCSTCDNKWEATGSDRTLKNSGCPCCKNGYLHSDGKNSMAVTHPHLALEYQGDATKIVAGTNEKLPWKCSICEHQWEAQADTRSLRGIGCPSCAKRGFRPNEAGHVYLMKYEGANEKVIYKIGISHDVEERRKKLLSKYLQETHSEVNIDIIDTMYFDTGKDAMEMEKAFHAMEEHRFTPKKKFEGWTEMFKASIVDVWNRMVKT